MSPVASQCQRGKDTSVSEKQKNDYKKKQLHRITDIIANNKAGVRMRFK
jgi:hypothetical protein